MDCIELNKQNIWGKVTHYKENKAYIAICAVIDQNGNKFVLYREVKGNQIFWMRPVDNFFSSVTVNGIEEVRFKETTAPRTGAKRQIEKIIELLKKDSIEITNELTSEKYCITSIDSSELLVQVCKINSSILSSRYLTDYELAKRMGYSICVIDGHKQITKLPKALPREFKLSVEDNPPEVIQNQFNPCSIDLRIAEKGFLKTRRKLIDPKSIEHISNSIDLWKKKRVYKSKGVSQPPYIKLRPGETVITHIFEKIQIPSDCIGKIEIKSTYARLSLQITSGDFCNPGYCGYFPLEIHNMGKHTIILHAKETMAQLMLITLPGPIISEYYKNATHKDDQGIDSGTPFKFWQERSIKSMQSTAGADKIIRAYKSVLKNFNASNTDDINSVRARFEGTFLPFCHRNLHKEQYKNPYDDLPDVQKLFDGYIAHEKRLKYLFGCRWLTLLLTIAGIVLQFIPPAFLNVLLPAVLVKKALLVLASIMLVLSILAWINLPKGFCTLEQMDIKKIIMQLESEACNN